MDITQFPSWIMTGIFGVIGVAVGWGYFKAEMKNLQEKVNKSEGKIEVLTTGRIGFALKTDCEKLREECKDGTKEELSSIKKAIDNNREVVLEKFDEVKEFMGYVKGKIEDYNGRLR